MKTNHKAEKKVRWMVGLGFLLILNLGIASLVTARIDSFTKAEDRSQFVVETHSECMPFVGKGWLTQLSAHF